MDPKEKKTESSSGIDRSSYSATTKESKVESSSSSSSNTPRVIPVASSNDSCQETSLEIQSRKLIRTCTTDYSACTELKSNFEESDTVNGSDIRDVDDNLGRASSPGRECDTVKGSETVDSGNVRNSDNLSGVRSSDDMSAMSSENNYAAIETEKLVVRKLEDAGDVASAADREIEASASQRNGETFRAGFVDSNRKSCITETRSAGQEPGDQDKSFSFCSRPSTVPESSCVDVEQPAVRDLHGHESSSRGVKGKGLQSRGHVGGDLCEFDLNEDAVDVEHDVGPVLSKPKPLMAKPGTPLHFSISHSQDNGKLGGWTWRGSTTANSAFRPIEVEENRLAMKSIDLNLEAVGAECEFEYVQDKSEKARKLDFDLNSVGGENDSDLATRKSVRDFDLNDDLVIPAAESSKEQDFQSFGPAHSSDFRPVPSFIQTHFQPFLISPPNIVPSGDQLQRVSYLQPQFAYGPSIPHFQVDPKAGLSSVGPTHGVFPYMVDPHIASQVPGFPSHVFHVPNGATRLNVEAYNGARTLESVDVGANSGQLRVPLTNSGTEQMKSFHQFGVSAAGMKRREPEGGWDSSRQLCFRQMTSWH